MTVAREAMNDAKASMASSVNQVREAIASQPLKQRSVLIAYKIVLRSAHRLISDVEHASRKDNSLFSQRLQAILILIEDELLIIDAGIK